MKKIIFIGACLLPTPLFAYSAATVAELKMQCTADSTKIEGALFSSYCAGVLNGLSEMHTIYADEKMGLGKRIYCSPPEGISNEQTVAIFLKWANEHPQDASKRASIAFLAAMKHAYPCN